MNNVPMTYPCAYCANAQLCNAYKMQQCLYFTNSPMFNPGLLNQSINQYSPYTGQANKCKPINLKDYGPEPFVVNIEEATIQNYNFRTALWTGKHLQLTLMKINAGEDIGLEVHPNLDQFVRIEEGQGLVKMGDTKSKLDFQANVAADYAFIIPAGKWHNLINTGYTPLKLYSIYAPPQHPYGTVHKTKADAEDHHKA